MLKSETRTINGMQISCTQMPVCASYEVAAKVGALIGAGASELKGIDFASFGQSDITQFGPGLSVIMSELVKDPELPLQLVNGMTVVVDGRLKELSATKESVNAVFGGDLKTYLLALKFSLELNFASFFGGGFLTSAVEAGQKALNREKS